MTLKKVCVATERGMGLGLVFAVEHVQAKLLLLEGQGGCG